MRKTIAAIIFIAMNVLTARWLDAQQAKRVPRIGYLSLAAQPSARDEAFVQALRELGWVNGQNITIEYRWAANKPESKDAQDASQGFKIRFLPLVLKNVDEIDSAFQSMVKERAGALIVQTLFSVLGQNHRIAQLAVKYRMPTISDNSQFAEAGGLMSYGRDALATFRHAANYVDKILKGR